MNRFGVASTVLLPFATVTLIWSSTWIVIRDQLGVVPSSWSVCYRFLLAAAGMAVLARLSGASLRLDRRAKLFAAVLGIMHFSLNFNLLYRAEAYLTSGLCALVYALLMIPNSLFARIAYGERVSRAFMTGSLIAIIGVSLLFLNEYRTSITGSGQEVLFGLGLCLLAVLSASIANVMQAAPLARAVPMATMLAWSMAIGALVDAVFAWSIHGPPVIDVRPGYWAGVAYLALAGSVITFPLYFGLVQRLGAGQAAYASVLIPILAMAISTLLEGYRWTPLAMGGVVLSLAGMIIALRERFRREAG